MESNPKHYRMDTRQIGFLRFLLEGYDGIASLTTLGPRAGHVILSIPPGREPEVEALLEDLRRAFLIEAADPETAGF